ncbi:hypothetical protein [Rhodoligotrophos ferricapiens]|uniref:hypothetical protein n=1 Tax=Rhodoligotrophos ferricapiens TaxID=3069264 RepID=UPI00315D31B3
MTNAALNSGSVQGAGTFGKGEADLSCRESGVYSSIGSQMPAQCDAQSGAVALILKSEPNRFRFASFQLGENDMLDTLQQVIDRMHKHFPDSRTEDEQRTWIQIRYAPVQAPASLEKYVEQVPDQFSGLPWRVAEQYWSSVTLDQVAAQYS